MPVGPLAISDEVSMSLMQHIIKQTKQDFEKEKQTYQPHPAEKVIDEMTAMKRSGKANKAGFYEYPNDGKKFIWPELSQKFPEKEAISFQDMKDRLLFIMAIETVRCLEEKVLMSVGDANIGSIFGLGYAPWSGGCLQIINHYGVRKFCERAIELTEKYGSRFQPPALLLQKAEKSELFQD